MPESGNQSPCEASWSIGYPERGDAFSSGESRVNESLKRQHTENFVQGLDLFYSGISDPDEDLRHGLLRCAGQKMHGERRAGLSHFTCDKKIIETCETAALRRLQCSTALAEKKLDFDHVILLHLISSQSYRRNRFLTILACFSLFTIILYTNNQKKRMASMAAAIT